MIQGSARNGEGSFEGMIARPGSRILRAGSSAHPQALRTGVTPANPHARRVNPIHTAVHSVTFVGSLLALGFFAIINWSETPDDAGPVSATPQTSQAQSPEGVLEQRAMIAKATSPSTLLNFYGGELTDPDNPIAVYQGPVLAEDGSGPLPLTNGYGAPTAQLFGQEAGGWGIQPLTR